MSETHYLKAWTEPFDAVWHGLKKAEFRLNDRSYAVWDVLNLNEWLPGYSGRYVRVLVTHIVEGPAFGIPKGYAMLSFNEMCRGTWANNLTLEMNQQAVEEEPDTVRCDGSGYNWWGVECGRRSGYHREDVCGCVPCNGGRGCENCRVKA